MQTPLLKGGLVLLQIAFQFTPIQYNLEVWTFRYSVKWTVFFDPKSTCTTQTLLDNADASMLFKQGCPQPLIDSTIRHYSLWSAFFPVWSKVELWIAAL